MSRKPKEFKDFPEKLNFPNYTYKAFCINVIDGDTIDVLVDLGMNQYCYSTIRVKDVDTPEIFRPSSDLEKQRGFEAKQLVEDHLLNKPVLIKTYKDKTSFGRYVAEVLYIYEENLTSISATIIEKGLTKK
jgi:micrococcal nuclease